MCGIIVAAVLKLTEAEFHGGLTALRHLGPYDSVEAAVDVLWYKWLEFE
jgi:hypothetical protein